MIVRIFDVSSFCHAGSFKDDIIDGPVSEFDDKYKTLDLPAGGISFLFNQVAKYYRNDVLIFTCDRYATIKRGMYADYKGNRSQTAESVKVNKHKEVAEVILKDCGFPTLGYDGYEADDVMYTLCKTLKTRPDVEHIFIYPGDSDLYLCIDDKVTVEPVRSKDPRITKANFEYTVRKGKVIPYNTLTFDKILYGCSSDNVPGIGSEGVSDLRKYFYHPFYYDVLGDKETMFQLVDSLCPQYKQQFELIFPLDVDIDEDVIRLGDKEKILMWADAMNHRAFPRHGARDYTIEKAIDDMTKRGLYIQ